jgi:predicted TIM-barrel fold metal-dependent hydrolase
MQRIVIVSGDGHVTPVISDIIGYLDPVCRIYVDDLIRESVQYVGGRATPARPPRLTVPMFDERGLVRGGGEYGASHPAIRTAQMDAEGVAGEILIPGTQVGSLPFFSPANAPRPPEVRAAGARAYHRWLADFMSECGGRAFGVAEAGPCLDLDETIAELEWCAAHGFVSVTPPNNTADTNLPPLYDPYFERFWSACVDLGLVLTTHAGWNGEQQVLVTQPNIHMMGDGESTGGHDFEVIHKAMQERGSPIRIFLQQPRRPMWMLMAGGVFDRHPGLRLALTEIRADWVPATLDFLERTFAEVRPPCLRSPREYYLDHVLVVPSSPHRSEVDMRADIGVEQFGFGQDFPHWEGLWPNTLDWLRHAFGGVPEDEVRAILGGNAIRFYNLPAGPLAEAADRFGPTATDVLGDHQVPDELVQHFHRRSGYLRSADPVFEDELESIVGPDLAGAAAAASVR